MATAIATRSAPQASSIGMFMIELTFAVSLTTLQANEAAHVRFLRRQYARGVFLIAQRPRPGDREIIVAVASDREELLSVMREDPLCELGLADVRIVQLAARAPHRATLGASTNSHVTDRVGAAAATPFDPHTRHSRHTAAR